MNNFITGIVARLLSGAPTNGVFVGRATTHDEALKYRMRTGFSGDVNRAHPASIEPCAVDAVNPPTFYGCALFDDGTAANAVRGALPSDTTATDIAGFLVRPFPTQQQSATNYGATAFGNGTPSTTLPADKLTSGYGITAVSGTAPTYKGARVFVWVAASTGTHVQGGFEAVATAGSTLALDTKSKWNGPAGADGLAEIAINL